MISHKHNCIFIHIPKCAGTSMEVILRQHASALGFEKEEGLEYKMREEGLATMINLYPHYFTFTFVRNPFDRFVSIWKHSTRSTGSYFDRPHKHGSLFDRFVSIWKHGTRSTGSYFDRHNKHLSLKEYAYLVAKGAPGTLSRFDVYHTRKQIDFILDFNKSHFFGIRRVTSDNCRMIGRFENLHVDFQQVCRRLNIQNNQLPLLQASQESMQNKRLHYSTYYDQETLEIVRDLYKEDLNSLGYEFERPSADI